VSIGLRMSWRDKDHYDLTPDKRALALKRGAVVADEAALKKFLETRRSRRVNVLRF